MGEVVARIALVLLLGGVAWAQGTPLASAKLKFALGDYKGALADFDKAIEGAPGDTDAHEGRAKALYMLGRNEDALKSIERAMELAPERESEHLHARSWIRFRLGDYQGALADVSKALESDSSNALKHRTRARMRMAMWDYDGALHDFSKACELNPRDLDSLDGRAEVKLMLLDFKGAMGDYAALVRLAPGNPRPWICRADIHRWQGDWEAAIRDYDAALSRQQDAYAYVGRARAKLAMGDKVGADADALKALEAGADESAHFQRGLFYYDTGRLREAAADFAEAVKLDPASPGVARLYLLLARAACGERAAGAAELREFIDRRGNSDDWYAKGALFLCGVLKETEFHEASKSGEASRAPYRECGACWYSGALRLLDGDTEGARALFERCLATGVKHTSEYESARMALAAMK